MKSSPHISPPLLGFFRGRPRTTLWLRRTQPRALRWKPPTAKSRLALQLPTSADCRETGRNESKKEDQFKEEVQQVTASGASGKGR